MSKTADAVADQSNTNERPTGEIQQALKRLDGLLQQAVDTARRRWAREPGTDPFRGLYISEQDIVQTLSCDPITSILWGEKAQAFDENDARTTETSRLEWLRETFGLTDFDAAMLLIALAPELDLRYERIFAYLQDDVSKKRPTIDLALNLLCGSVETKLTYRDRFASNAPLIQYRIIHLIPDPNQTQPPLLAHYLKLDEQIVRLLLDGQALDARLVSFSQLIEPTRSLDELPLAAEKADSLAALVSQAWNMRRPLRLYFQGPNGMRKRDTAEALAAEVGTLLLQADLAQLLADLKDPREQLQLLFREAWFQDAILYLEGLDVLLAENHAATHQRLVEMLADDHGITIVAGKKPWQPSSSKPVDMHSVPFPIPAAMQRKNCWRTNLKQQNLEAEEPAVGALAERFRLTPVQIAEAVATAAGYAHWRTMSKNESDQLISDVTIRLTTDDLFRAARAQSAKDLDALAQKIVPHYTWEDIVLPEDALAQLREICQRVAHRYRVLGEWGFDHKLSLGKGVNALFAGPSGTGKTMAAEIVARELGLDLYRIDLSGVVSKYIGETEKNLDRIFRAAENANAILFFDEADALFGKRSEVRDSHDRYANIEISYLLQKMEQFDGIAILATNLRGHLDDAFTRRLAFNVHFPVPDESHRQKIWDRIWPAETPLADDLDFDFMAQQFKLTGGNIKNIALAAAFYAAEDDSPVTMAHLRQATRREFQKMGKALSEVELTDELTDAQPMARIAV